MNLKCLDKSVYSMKQVIGRIVAQVIGKQVTVRWKIIENIEWTTTFAMQDSQTLQNPALVFSPFYYALTYLIFDSSEVLLK
jgi:hypothetical protein